MRGDGERRVFSREDGRAAEEKNFGALGLFIFMDTNRKEVSDVIVFGLDTMRQYGIRPSRYRWWHYPDTSSTLSTTCSQLDMKEVAGFTINLN